ncbi:MAG: hypothetical protein QM504_10430 [Pseudomonadota bacterium]
MSELKKDGRGGIRPNSGRPKGEGGKLIRVPTNLVQHIEGIISAYKTNQRKLEKKEGR